MEARGHRANLCREARESAVSNRYPLTPQEEAAKQQQSPPKRIEGSSSSLVRTTGESFWYPSYSSSDSSPVPWREGALMAGGGGDLNLAPPWKTSTHPRTALTALGVLPSWQGSGGSLSSNKFPNVIFEHSGLILE